MKKNVFSLLAVTLWVCVNSIVSPVNANVSSLEEIGFVPIDSKGVNSFFAINPALEINAGAYAFTVTSTPETCTGNGEIIIDFTGTTIGDVFEVTLYKDGNTVTPFRVTSDISDPLNTDFQHVETDLPSGSFEVRIAKTAGLAEADPNPQTIIVSDNVEDVVFDFTTEFICGGSEITVNVTAGNPATYFLTETVANGGGLSFQNKILIY